MSARSNPPPSTGSDLPPLVRYIMIFLGCVGLPAFFTAVAPLSVVQFDRSAEGTIFARASTRFFFVIPYRHVYLGGVNAVSDCLSEGSQTRSGMGSSRRSVHSEDSAFLTIESPAGAAEIEVSPASIARVLTRTRAFLENPAERHLRLIVVANWKFGVFAGGFLTIIALLYFISIARWTFARPRNLTAGEKAVSNGTR